MANPSDYHDASKHAIIIDDMVSKCAERDLLLKMVGQDDFSTAAAVEAMLALTTAAATKVADSPVKDEDGVNALWIHADTVAAVIIALAKRTPHDQQSKLVDFTVRLRQATVPNPKDSGILQLKDLRFWSDIPQLSINLAEEWLRDSGSSVNETRDRDFANLSAFYAQLAEVRFGRFHEGISWNLPRLTCMFKENYTVTRQDVRVACIWFIYAPEKVWLDVKLRRKRETSAQFNQFKPEFWPRWKQFLHECQHAPSEKISNQEIQDLTRRALDSMIKMESMESK